MSPRRKNTAASLATPATALLTLAASMLLFGQPQTPSPPVSALKPNLVVLDPAHGGPDSGTTLADHVLEKDVTLALAVRLRAALTAAGFTVVSTRDTDSLNPLTTDQRAEIANRTHAVACIILHATATGSGVHLYTSTLQPSDDPDKFDATSDADTSTAFVPVPWEAAQAASVRQSLRLAGDLGAALGKANLPALSGRAPLRPLDNLTCPAIAIELAPLVLAGQDATPVTDPAYQQRVATAIAGALSVWRDHAAAAQAGTP